MRNMKCWALAVWTVLSLLSCGGSNNNGDAPTPNPTPDPDPDPVPVMSDFVKGADIGWVTEMEAGGHKFYGKDGKEADCFQVMKDFGMNAIRLRVWVDPAAHGNWCNTTDLVNKAKRAVALGMDVMVDFHYSDWWADPGQQHKPSAWKGLNLNDLKGAITTHTKDVLNALKTAGVTPRWVQVGNEIRPGMLWDENASLSGASYNVRACDVKDSNTSSTEVKYPENWANLAAFINVGYEAVKAVFDQAIVIVHLDNGYDNGTFTWFFDELKKNGGKWDMIGMSLYPYWTMMEKKDYTADQIITLCIDNIKSVSQRYDCDVMIVETGMECADENGKLASESVLNEGKRQLASIIKQSRDNTNGRCKGVLYWEPECKPSQYRLGAFTEEGHPTVIMDAFAE